MIYLKILRNYLFIIFFFVFSCNFYSQNNQAKIDSIKKLIDQSYFAGNIHSKDVSRYITELYYLSKESGSAQGQLLSIFEEFKMYTVTGNFAFPLSKIEEGIKLAESRNDYNMLCRLSLLYQKQISQLNYLSEAKQILEKCTEYNKQVTNEEARRINETYLLIAKADILTNNEGLSRDMKPVISFKKQAYSEALKIKNSNRYKKYIVIHTLESLAWSVALSEDIPEARKYTTQIDKLLKTYPNNDLIIQNLIIKGAIENIAENYKAAIEYLSQVISKAEQNEDTYTLYTIYPMISASYGQLKDYENSTLYSWKFKHLADSINTVKQNVNDTHFINKINDKIYSIGKKKETNNVPIIVIITIIIVSGILFIIKKKKNINKPQLEESKELPEEIEKPVSSDSYEAEITKNLVNLAKEDINVFYIEFHKAYPAFHQFLKQKYPELNISDLNFCSLIKMNFGLKEISVYTNSSIRSVESRRFRIIKKMDMKGQNDLYMFISKLI